LLIIDVNIQSCRCNVTCMLSNVQIRRQFFRALSSVDCQRQLVSTLVDVAVESTHLHCASAAVSCLKQVFTIIIIIILRTIIIVLSS